MLWFLNNIGKAYIKVEFRPENEEVNLREDIITGLIGAAIWSCICFVAKIVFEHLTQYKVVIVKKKTWENFKKIAPNLVVKLRK